MTASLQYTRGQEDRVIACSPLLTIGRTPPNDIVIPHPKVSRSHALIRMLKPGEYYIIDVGSTNGTFLNGKRVVTPTLLKDLDAITFEDCVLTFRSGLRASLAPDEDEEGQLSVTMTSMGVQMEAITLLVCDIRNYTPISESMSSSELASLMARWFKMATKAIDECSGTIDKFIGDAIMVRWSAGTGRSDPSAVMNALRTALKLNAICLQINAAFTRLPHPFKLGVGINTGPAVLGSIGGSGYREYTVIGDSVNVAFRFETESKSLGKDVVVGPESYKYLPPQHWSRSLQSITVKGKSEPISVWAITFDELDAVLSRGAKEP